MRYYLMDTAGRFLSPNLKFDTYDHNHALKFSDYMEAKRASLQHCAYKVITI